MAGFYNKIIRQGFGDSFKAVVLCCVVLILIFPQDVLSEYKITKSDGQTITTQCYWLQKDRLYLCEGGEGLVLNSIQSIENNSNTDQDKTVHQETLTRFYATISWLLGEEEALMLRENENTVKVKKIEEIIAGKQKDETLSGLVKDSKKEIKALELQVSLLKGKWDNLVIPDKSLMLIRDIKSLQLLSMSLSIQERLNFIKTLDPTHREYYKEHLKQARTFETIFDENLKKYSSTQ